MNFDPQKLFIGLMDFFSILLPGALLTYLLKGDVGPVVLGQQRYDLLEGAQAVAAFVFVSYLVGHLVFLLGSWLDEIYDWLRNRTLNWQVKQVARRGRLLWWPVRRCISLVFKREDNRAVERVLKIKRHMLGKLQADDAVKAFQWCKALLNVESAQSMAVVQRFEADSKFFRCFAVVLLILLGWKWKAWTRNEVFVILALFLIALWRYMEQRYKATNQAYWSVITLTARDGTVVFDKSAKVPNPTHAGGVVFRKRWWGGVKYLLLEAKDDPAQWVLPKGHVEEDEQHRDAAVREVLEETGVWAAIVSDLRDMSFLKNGVVETTRVFLMRGIGRGPLQEKDRKHQWLSLDRAVCQASYGETRELLREAERLRSVGPKARMKPSG
jgi:ADP-ribose pyrophosphatase YjhB (NUDIX family)